MDCNIEYVIPKDILEFIRVVEELRAGLTRDMFEIFVRRAFHENYIETALMVCD